MRRLIFPALLAAAALAQAQTWEKPLAPGVAYRMVARFDRPLVYHAIRVRSGVAEAEVRPALAGGKVFPDAESDGRATLGEIVRSSGALAGLNADFFPWTGDPLGIMVVDGEIVSRPYPGRSALAWGGGAPTVARLGWSATADLPAGPVALTGLNEELGNAGCVLVTPAGGHVRSRAPATVAVLEWEGKLAPTGTAEARVVTVLTDSAGVPVRTKQLALAAAGPRAAQLAALRRGDAVALKMETTGVDWAKAKHAVGGGPAIVTGGDPLLAWEAESFTAQFATGRHPRSAVGVTKAGDLWLVAVDGRQSHSPGVTLAELGAIMASLGCREAINLDGGGSTSVAVGGLVLNRPSDGLDRPVANALLVFAKPFAAEAGGEILGRDEVAVGDGADYRVSAGGRDVPSAAVVWAASGAAWMDQSGRLRPFQSGEVVVRAWYGGRSAEKRVKVVARTPARASG
jgi:hypothetical protein